MPGGALFEAPTDSKTRPALRGDSAFFMTAVEGPEEPEKLIAGSTVTAVIASPPKKEEDPSKRLMRRFDPDRWMKRRELPPIRLVQERIAEEEAAAVEWYQASVTPAPAARSSWRNKVYNWPAGERHRFK
jgi:hypothetical protein